MRPRFTAIFGGFSWSSLYNAESPRILSPLAIALLFAVLATSGCASQPEPLTAPWTLTVSTSGGLSGKGLGTWVVTSEGAISVTSPQRRTCSTTITPDELKRIEALLAAARFEEWAPSYSPRETCCDRIAYTLSVGTSRREFTTRWIDDPLPMPDALVRLASAIGPWSSTETSLSRRYRCE